MATPEEIQSQLERLQGARAVLDIYLNQLIMLGTAYAPPALFTSIRETRFFIQQTKKQLSLWNVEVEDQLADEDHHFELPATNHVPRTLSAPHFIAQLGSALLNDPDTKTYQSRELKLDFLAIHETTFTIDTIGLVHADQFNDTDFAATHRAYHDLISAWRPSAFFKRAWKKNSLLGFVFEKRCDIERIIWILKQKQDANPIFDATVSFSWIIDLEMHQLYTHDIIVASTFPTLIFPQLSYPSKSYLEHFIARYSSENGVSLSASA